MLLHSNVHYFVNFVQTEAGMEMYKRDSRGDLHYMVISIFQRGKGCQ